MKARPLIGRRSHSSQASNREAVFSDLNRLQSHLTNIGSIVNDQSLFDRSRMSVSS